MHHGKHAQEISARFRDMVNSAGDSLSSEHYDALSLLIEAGIDAALVDYMETTASKLEKMAHDVRHSAEFFEAE